MTNDDIQHAWEFHNGTKHPGGALNNIYPDLPDRGKRPRRHKKYLAELDAIDLTISDDFEDSETMQTLEAITDRDERFPYLETLGKILHYSAGITKTLRFPKKDDPTQKVEVPFRAASCTGALYHIEIYVITSRIPGLRAGIYHYDPIESRMQLLHKGDHRQSVVMASGENYSVEEAPVILAFTSDIWRNAYKYKTRAYRHAFWDLGTVMSQTLAMTSMYDLSSSVVMGFVDKEVSKILGLVDGEEFPLALLPIGYSSFTGLGAKPVDATDYDTFAVENDEFKLEYPAIVDFHEQSSLTTVSQVEEWRHQELELSLPSKNDHIQLKPQSTRKMETAPLEKVIKSRGSTRKFSLEYIDLQTFSNVLKMGTQPFEADFYSEFGQRYNRVYVVANAVEDLQMGAYRFYPEDSQLVPLKQGYFREQTKKMGLSQALGHDCAAMIVFIADLNALTGVFGNRGYRVAQLEASILAGKMYLASYAQNIGATGLTFEDDEVTTFFNEEDKIATFMLCIGHKA